MSNVSRAHWIGRRSPVKPLLTYFKSKESGAKYVALGKKFTGDFYSILSYLPINTASFAVADPVPIESPRKKLRSQFNNC